MWIKGFHHVPAKFNQWGAFCHLCIISISISVTFCHYQVLYDLCNQHHLEYYITYSYCYFSYRYLSGFSAANPTNGGGLSSPGIHYTSKTEKVSLDNKMEMEDLPAESYEEVEAPNPLPIPPKPQPKKAQNKSRNAAQKVDSSRYARGAQAAPTTGPKPTGSRPHRLTPRLAPTVALRPTITGPSSSSSQFVLVHLRSFMSVQTKKLKLNVIMCAYINLTLK